MSEIPSIFVDTNILRSVGWKTASWQALLELSVHSKVKIFVSAITFEERRTQWRDDYKSKLTKVTSTFNELLHDAFLPASIKDKVRSAIIALPTADAADAVSVEVFEKAFTDHKIARVQPSLPHFTETLRRYFIGDPPFKKIKNRDDLPDGLILAAADEIVKESGSLHCICLDQTLSKAISALPGAIIYDSVDELMKAPPLAEARKDWEDEGVWQKVKVDVTVELLEREAKEFVSENIDKLVGYKRVKSNEIPDDNNEGIITMFDEPETVSVSQLEDWGSGWIGMPVEFDLGVLIDFHVYRGDINDVPDWVSVSFGDPEEDHYFEAEGSIRVHVSLTLSAHVDLSEGKLRDDAPFDSIELDGNVRIELVEVG